MRLLSLDEQISQYLAQERMRNYTHYKTQIKITEHIARQWTVNKYPVRWQHQDHDLDL